VRIERRLEQPRWLTVAVPIGSIAFSFALMAIILVATGHDPGATYRRLLDAAFVADGSLTSTLTFATPIVFTGLCAAAAFRMQLYNIGGEGQFFLGATAAVGIALYLGDHGVTSTPLYVLAMCAAGGLAGAAWASIPAILRAFFKTNEIITSLMLNYVVALVLDYLIFDSHSYLRDTSGFEANVFPQGKILPDEATWPSWSFHGVGVPLGAVVVVVLAFAVWGLYNRTRFGFEVKVIGDSARAGRYAGMRTRRKIVAVMCLSGAIAGIGGASQDGDFRHQLDPRGLTQANYGYAGIVVAALARYNPIAVLPIAFLLGGLQNAGFTLQGADFPSGLVGVMQGLILFCALGGELFVRYRIRFVRRHAPAVEAAS
jgi:general nucleoside transport system permease protein